MGKSSKRALTPKRLAGLKLPKPLRKGVGKFLRSEAGQAMLAEAIAAGAAVFAAAALERREARKIKKKAVAEDTPTAAETTPEAAEPNGAAVVSHAFGEGVKSFTRALHSGGAPHRRLKTSAKAAKAPSRKKTPVDKALISTH